MTVMWWTKDRPWPASVRKLGGPDYVHWHGFFQMFRVYKDMQDIYDWRMKSNKIEDLSMVMNSGPL